MFREKPELQLLYGNVVLDYGKMRKLRRYNNIDRIFFACSMICHQVIFAQKELFVKHGYFDEEFVIKADYDWLLNNFLKNEVVTCYLDRTISVYDMLGMSRSQHKFLNEIIGSKKKYFSNLELLFYYPLCVIRKRFGKLFFEERI